MTFPQAIFLGIAQGASEFLPISSSAHLVIVPWLFDFPDPGLAFDVALHFGTLFAVVLYFWKDWVNIFWLSFSPRAKLLEHQELSSRTLWLIILATIPGVLAGYFLESYAETTFRSPVLIAFTLSFVGLLLYLADKYHQHRKNLKQVGWVDSIIVGLSQALAIIPGVSRSGATITAGLFQGLNRQSAARFSFLLSTPIIFGASVKQFPEFISGGVSAPAIVGMIAAAASGYLAIKYLLKFVEKSSYAVFFWYRLVLAAVILAVYFST